jgi:lipoyl(octanoyl) transferase
MSASAGTALPVRASPAAAHACAVPAPVIRRFGLCDYQPTWRAMQRFTEQRDAATADEIWFLEHPPVFTLGVNASRAHLIAPGDIAVVQSDRGGQVTYHGPGQLIVYPLLDLRRLGLGVRPLVSALETAMLATLAEFGIEAHARCEAPGIYVGAAKLASIGLRIRRGRSYHGLALNVAMDLEPFARIDPCGFRGLKVVDLRELGVLRSPHEVALPLVQQLWRSLRLAGEVPSALVEH